MRDSSPDDPRFRRSRDRLLAALRQVAREGDLTIPAVSVAAGVTRATFYNHFTSLDEAAWYAMLDSFDELLSEDAAARRAGADPAAVGLQSLRKIVELLRVDGALARLADSYPSDTVLPGLADVVLAQVRWFRTEFGTPTTLDPAAEEIYVAAGLYALLATGARGDDDPVDVALVAYSLLPEWMRHTGSGGPSAQTI
ncbi:TetR/AcrR family transcriptional regulator [Mycobacterium hodleri]|uniref:TetR/AcrR family transcriptional regulator n=1 Tax=Mycolicibacterium hodleri TaxID=49897 RepID=A0A544VU33_9MYCO|nr:TetR/AcrR family transcriptional regulator [Mycolicibacterium hodleri]TQR83478.1 TetR/AcrR family transcriptional regulator [Mycolicibacterium hodleri]